MAKYTHFNKKGKERERKENRAGAHTLERKKERKCSQGRKKRRRVLPSLWDATAGRDLTSQLTPMFGVIGSRFLLKGERWTMNA